MENEVCARIREQQLSRIRKERELGMLIGLHAGDSLGATGEFGQPNTPETWQKDIIGGGYFKWAPGEATDDTDLAICILETLAAFKSLNVPDLEKRFIHWADHAPHDMGMTTKLAIANMRGGKYPTGINREKSQSNGSLMRCAPLALLSTITDADVRTCCAMTHAHPNCIEADAIFIQAIRNALDGKTKREIFNQALVQSKVSESLCDLLIQLPTVKWENLKTSGHVGATLGAGFYALMMYETFEEGIEAIANRGDDSDTCAAVAGALCGAYYGLNQIPERWVKMLKRKDEMVSLWEKIHG